MELPIPTTAKILVVDDQEMNRDLLIRRLEREGYEYDTATNGFQAMDKIRKTNYDLILLDIVMPGMTGEEVLKTLKKDEKLRYIPVIMISSMNDIERVARSIEGGAEDYLTKPFNPIILRARLNSSLEKKFQQDKETFYLNQVEAQKKRTDDLLSNILPRPIIEELKQENHSKPRYFENIAVLFADIVGFTPFCDKHTPEEVIQYLQEVTRTFEKICDNYNLEKIKTIGDAFMCAAGMFEPLENPVYNAVKAALAMTFLAPRLSGRLEIRVGIHYGTVIGGIIGEKKFAFDIWGDTVNVAARLESTGIPGKVCVSTEAWEKIKGQCIGRSRGMIDVKGKDKHEVFVIQELLIA